MRIAPLLVLSLFAVASSHPAGSGIDEEAVAALQPQASELRFDHVSPGILAAAADRQLAAARSILDRLVAVTGPRTIENTLQPYDELFQQQNAVFNFLTIVHRDQAIRTAAAREFARLRAFRVALNQDRRVYDALVAIDLRQADPETRHYVDRVLNNLRENGVERDESTRRKLGELQAEILRLEQEFAGNLRTRGVSVSFTADELEGVPADWLASQSRGPNGEVIVGQGLGFVLRFARNPNTRERAMISMQNGAKGNHDTLTELLRARNELAVIRGSRNAADLQLKTLMAKSPANVTKFLDDLRSIYEPGMRRSHEAAVGILRRELPDVTRLTLANYMYAARKFREDELNIDVVRLREYFTYERVRDAAMTTARDVFGVEFRPVTDAPVWDPTVETYDAFDGTQRIGRLYLDTVIRPGTTVPTATHPIRSGLKSKTIAEVAITAPMKRATPGEPSLLDPLGVTSLFHEMGHAIHHILAARRWAGTSGQVAERDFSEVPSNFFTEWSRDPRVVKSMARHYKTGEPMPSELLAMIQTSDDNQNLFRLPVAHWQARLSLALHNQPTVDVHVDAVVRQTMAEYLPYQPPTAEIHPEASFSHLQGYGAAYYTYLWSAVIAKDFEQEFGGDLFNKKVAIRYRQAVLEGGRSVPAVKLVENFLGRPFSVKPWGDWVAKTK